MTAAMATTASVPAPKIRRPVLRYHGGKFGVNGGMADWIIGRMPKHRIYVEPFGGGASVLMRKPRAYAEVYNDIWSVVVDVFRVLRDPAMAAELERRIRLTPFARAEFEAVTDASLAAEPDVIERARMTILRSFAGFGSAATNGAHATGFRATSYRSGKTPAHDWANYPGHIAGFTRRLAGVVVECRPAAKVMAKHDGPETLHYVDPPYEHSTRNMRRGNAAYAHEMTEQDHRDLAAFLRTLRGVVILSGYPSPLYRELYGDWRCERRQALADGARKRVECLWFNPAAAAAVPPAELGLEP